MAPVHEEHDMPANEDPLVNFNFHIETNGFLAQAMELSRSPLLAHELSHIVQQLSSSRDGRRALQAALGDEAVQFPSLLFSGPLSSHDANRVSHLLQNNAPNLTFAESRAQR